MFNFSKLQISPLYVFVNFFTGRNASTKKEVKNFSFAASFIFSQKIFKH